MKKKTTTNFDGRGYFNGIRLSSFTLHEKSIRFVQHWMHTSYNYKLTNTEGLDEIRLMLRGSKADRKLALTFLEQKVKLR